MKLILFELNEVPKIVLDDYIEKKPNSSLAYLLKQSNFYETFAEDMGELSPWVTWPTLHRGVTNNKHGISFLGQDLSHIDKEFPPIWNILNKNTISTAIFGSLGSSYENLLNSKFYLPDTFSYNSFASHDFLKAFQDFNLSMVNKSFRNIDRGVDLKNFMKLIRHINKLGISPFTIKEISKIILGEFYLERLKVRRRSLQPLIAFDIFYNTLKKYNPSFSTFFTNNVASSMHRFWAATYPHHYKSTSYDKDWIDDFKNEITYSMDIIDYMINKLIRLCKKTNYRLLIASSMGQEAVEHKMVHNEILLKDPIKFFSILGLQNNFRIQFPAMCPEYTFEFHDVRAISNFFNNCYILDNDKKNKVEFEILNDRVNFKFHFPDNDIDQLKFITENKKIALHEMGFIQVESDFNQSLTAYHVPEGLLIDYIPNHRKQFTNEKISTSSISPLILKNFDINVPKYMKF
ncbi:hypothetical protein ABXT57_02920 [Methylophilaceae bacterium Uisw_097]